MLDELKKKKMLERLNAGYNTTMTSAEDESKQAKQGYLKSIKSQGADLDTMKMLMGPKEVDSSLGGKMADKPVYEELKKVPLIQQMEMMRDNNDKYNQSAQEYQKEETDEEKKRRMLENMFGRKGNA